MRQSLGRRAMAVGDILIVFVGLFAAATLIGLVSVQLPARYATPVQALALWGGIGAGWIILRLHKSSYADLGFRRPASWAATFAWAATGLILALAGSIGLGEAIRALTDWPPLDVGYIRRSIEGDTLAWAMWMGLVVWGSAAFGEELLWRGFVMSRLQTVFGAGRLALAAAVLVQAAIFGLFHAIQGPTGAVITAWVGLVFAGIYLVSGRNLWAAILAHGIADTVSLTLIYAGAPLPGYIA